MSEVCGAEGPMDGKTRTLLESSARPISERYVRVYRMLKKAGFSPGKAVEILFDAKRRNREAIEFVRALRSATSSRSRFLSPA